MKNEIDELLDGLFAKNTITGQSKAAKEAEEFLATLSKKDKNVKKELDHKIEELEQINNKAKEQLAQISDQLKADGIENIQAIKVEEEPKKLDKDSIFKEALQTTQNLVIGQDEFLKKLSLAFKRPFVMGTEKDQADTVMVIGGKTGTGRHSALNIFTQNLLKHNLLKGNGTSVIDLELYPMAEDSKIFTQDIFGAIQSENTVIVFENYEKCHRSILNRVIEMVTTGKIQLGSRYANQKGMMIDVGTALVKDAISNISCAGKYLVFVTTDTKLGDKLGTAFMEHVKDICITAEFSSESIKQISNVTLKELAQKSLDKLNFTLTFDDKIIDYFSEKYSLLHGINSIDKYAQKCFNALSEHKLIEDAPAKTFVLQICEKTLCFNCEETCIKIEEVKEDNEALQLVKEQMNEIIGLNQVKDYILALQDNYKMAKIRGEMGLKAQSVSMHMIFTGNAGTGKTSIARLVSRYLKAIGVLTGGQLIEVSRADLVGKYVGHTAPLTKQIVDSAIGGVLFIDEAYSLCRGEDDNFGLEAIDTLVKCMEDNRENLVVILAGYTKEMETFLQSNSGLRSRFPNIIEFPDYTPEELYEITKLMAKNKGYNIVSGMEFSLLEYYAKKQLTMANLAGNGRMARNVLESAILSQSQRLLASGSTNYADLTNEDFVLT